MRAIWKKGNVISIKLSENLYSLAQMVNPIAKMRFYDVFNRKDHWQGIDLNDKKALLCVSVGNVVIQNLGVRRVPTKEVIPSIVPCERYVITPHDNFDGYRLRNEFVWKGGRLVDLGEGGDISYYYAPTIISNLTVEEHREIILKHEFSNMYGDKDVQNRLLQYYETGLNINPMKFDVFPELKD